MKSAALDDLADLAGIPEGHLARIREILLEAGVKLARPEHFSTYHAIWNTTPPNADGTLLTARDDARWRQKMQPLKASVVAILNAATQLRIHTIMIPATSATTASAGRFASSHFDRGAGVQA